MIEQSITIVPAGHRPRRALSVPRLAEADRLDPAELAKLRKQVARVRGVRGRSHADRPVCP
ncbi:MAG: hypothetical protein ACRDSP_25295 [Pseudonocardiaceae bacterium]